MLHKRAAIPINCESGQLTQSAPIVRSCKSRLLKRKVPYCRLCVPLPFANVALRAERSREKQVSARAMRGRFDGFGAFEFAALACNSHYMLSSLRPSTLKAVLVERSGDRNDAQSNPRPSNAVKERSPVNACGTTKRFINVKCQSCIISHEL